ncbi:metabolite traffic protein EboE [Pontibacter silvestris]|uniref:Metabolite traffic protein EboE n=1 Tax=Pontibacter silvestris TaxID=2305183 RepID=A0ABW4X0G2_9BACT|nr:metabolite traffic protein EboE [Pontibacter silvestris]MCC9136073.1 metabolite traffic protein EboE [Pontibacter silvestris]
MYLDQGYHLTYCTNIHPGETWEAVFQTLEHYLPQLKQKLSPDKPFGVGLRLSNQASADILEANKLQEFKQWLQEQDLYVFTMNGFPYGGFHQQVVKDEVHQPDWTTRQRLDYTVRLAHILAELLPTGMEGGISTSPLSYKPWLDSDTKTNEVFAVATNHLVELVEELLRLKRETGRTIHIDIEPEPDGLLENSNEVINYYKNWLLPIGIKQLQERLNLAETKAKEAIYAHLQLCYDVCHFALAYENHAEALHKLKGSGIRIGKVQLSAALKVLLSSDIKTRTKLAERLEQFAESTYLHQVLERNTDGTITQYPDLAVALPHIQKPEAVEWRTHFHVPLFTQTYNELQSTQDDIVEVLRLLQQEHFTQHLEVETYTWGVLPDVLKKDLSESVQRELEWVISTINNLRNAENSSTGRSRTDTVAHW